MGQKNCNLVWQNTFNKISKDKVKTHISERATVISDILSRSKEIESEVIVIKLSSDVIENDELLKNAVNNISILALTGAHIIIVHDYTNIVDETLKLFGIDRNLFSGSRIADSKTSEIIEMVLSGHINKKIVSALCAASCNAIGVSGKDGNMIEAKKRLKQRVASSEILELGFVGEPSIINPEVIIGLTDGGFIPVISPVAFGPDNSTYLLEVNLTVSIIACVTTAKHLIFMDSDSDFTSMGEVDFPDFCDHARLSHHNSSKQYIDIIGSALQNHTEYVHIVNAKENDSILSSIFASKRSTKIYLG